MGQHSSVLSGGDCGEVMHTLSAVMPGLDPASITASVFPRDMDHRVITGGDGGEVVQTTRHRPSRVMPGRDPGIHPHASSTTPLRSRPIPSASTSTTSPGFR